MTNSYANYAVPLVFKGLPPLERKNFLKMLQIHFNKIATTKTGTYPIQGLIQLLQGNEEYSIMTIMILNSLEILVEVLLIYKGYKRQSYY